MPSLSPLSSLSSLAFTYFFIYLIFFVGGGGGSSRPLDGERGGVGVQIFFFRPFGASVWFKNKGVGGEAGPYPGSATARSLGQQFGS